MPDKSLLAQQWEAGHLDRLPFIQRARECCAVTLPQLAPDIDNSLRGQDLVRPLQVLGPRGVHNLAAKLSIGLFPPQVPFFRYQLDAADFFREGVSEEELAQQFDDVKLSLSRRERQVQSKLDTTGFRGVSVTAFLQLLTSGNYLLEQLDDGSFRGFRLDQFQIKRDGEDKPAELLVRELVSRESLPLDIQGEVGDTHLPQFQGRGLVDLFTLSVRDPKANTWTVTQEVGGVSYGETLDVSDDRWRYIPLRMVSDPNEDYGRSFCEGYLGSLEVLEALAQSIVEYSAIASRVVPWIDPASGIRPTDFANAENGRPLIGNGDRVGFLGARDKLADIQVSLAYSETLTQDLKQIFLLLTPFRNAERVTQEEIRQTVAELTESLGGPYSTLAKEFQLPVARKTIGKMLSLGELTRIDQLDKNTTIKVVTGLDAIGRSREEVELDRYVASAQQYLGPEIVSQYINPRGYLTSKAAAQGLDPDALLFTEQEMSRRAQAAQQAKLIEQGLPPAISEAMRQGAFQQPQEG